MTETPQIANRFRQVGFYFSINEIIDDLCSLPNDKSRHNNKTSRHTVVTDDVELPIEIQKLSLTIPIIYLNINRTNQFLGRELSYICFDARLSFDVNAFSAIVGSLVGGGKLSLLLPENLKNFESLELKTLLGNGLNSPCLIRLIEILSHISAKRNDFGIHHKASFQPATILTEKSNVSGLSSNFIVEQNKLIDRIIRVSLGHANRPLVINAGRGKGKSSALGIASARLVFCHNKRIRITAPRKSNVDIFFQHFNTELECLISDKMTESAERSSVEFSNHLNFFAPDKLAQSTRNNDLLIVEEAGAIPVHLLEHITTRSNRIVFATTTDGYEGNGQGFEIRFKDYLNNKFNQWCSYSLSHPARFQKDDPLDTAIKQAFLFDTFSSSNDPNEISFSRLYLAKVDRNELIRNELLLKQIYSLLLTAHYQTRPSDLERILSNNDIDVYAASVDGLVISTLLIAREGSLTNEECQSIEQGKKRLPGNVIPQSLMSNQGIENAGKLVFWRIVRIATLPHFRNRSIASKLLAYVEKRAINEGVDIIATSFSINYINTHFWYKQGLQCNRVGLRKDSSTGQYTCEFLKLIRPSNSRAKLCFSMATKLFVNSYFLYLNSSLREVNTDFLVDVLENQIGNKFQHSILKQYETNTNSIEKDISHKEIERFLCHARSYEMVEWHIYSFFIRQVLSYTDNFKYLSKKNKMLLFKKILQQKSWNKIIIEQEFSGKKQAVKEFKNALTLLKS